MLEFLDFIMSAVLNIQHRVSNIEHLSGKSSGLGLKKTLCSVRIKPLQATIPKADQSIHASIPQHECMREPAVWRLLSFEFQAPHMFMRQRKIAKVRKQARIEMLV